MKKLLAFLLALTMALSLAACGGENNTDKDQNDQTQTETNTPADKDTAEQAPSQDKEEVKPEPDKGSDSAKDEPAQQPEVKSEEQPEEAPAITASHSDVTLKFAGETFLLTASNLPANAAVTYASEDETIAAVAEDGTVTAVVPGTTKVSLHIEEVGGASYDFTCIIRCKWSESTGTDLSAYFNDFMASLGEGNAPFMMEMNEDLMDAYYAGLTAIERKQTVMQMAAMSAVPFEFALVECANASDVETVKGIFQARKDYQVDGGAWYPETIEAWEKAEIVTSGNIVALISAGDAQQSAVDAFHTAFGK